MAASIRTFCTVCDPSSVLASTWCPECNDFLCLECEQHHKKLKATKDHSLLTLDKYHEFPKFVKDLNFTCDNHKQRFDSYCTAHNIPCCIRCVLTLHKSCQNVVPLTDLVVNCKTSSAMDDLETSLSDLISYLDKLTVEIDTHKKNITIQEQKIRDDVNEQRKALNVHLDKLEKNLLEALHTTFSVNLLAIETLAADITKITKNVQTVSSDLAKIKADASDLQTFLSIPCLQSMVSKEEKCVEKLQTDKLVRKDLDFINKCGRVASIDSLGEVRSQTSNFSTNYLRTKEKSAQLVGTMSHVIHKPVFLKLVNLKTLTLGSKRNIICGVTVTQGGNILIAEYNRWTYNDCISVHDFEGKLIKVRVKGYQETMFNLSRLQNTLTETALLSLRTRRQNEFGNYIILLETKNLKDINVMFLNERCYGVTGYDKTVFVCTENGIRKCKNNEDNKTLLVECVFELFSFIHYHDKKLYFTRGVGCSIVSCCDESGSLIWTFEDPKILQEARGIVVDTQGRVFVAGYKSNNIVCLNRDGRAAKEVQRLSSPLALCYDEKNNQLIVCNESDSAHIFRVCEE